MELKKLNGLITSIGKNAGKLREDIQSALIGCTEQVVLHRNTTPFNNLFAAVGAGTRLEGMLKWASLYAPVHFKDNKVVLSDKRQKEMANTFTEESLAAELATSEKWYAIAKPEKVENPWNSAKFAEGLAMYLENAAKKAEKNGDANLAQLVKDAEMLFRVKLNATYDVAEVEEALM